MAKKIEVTLVVPESTTIPSLIASPNTRDASGTTARLAIATALLALANVDVKSFRVTSFTDSGGTVPGYADDTFAI